jgi:hypothetical protein
MPERTIEIGLHLDGDGVPAGYVRSHAGSVPFQGRVGLFAVLERLLDEASREEPPPGPAGPA